MTQANGNNLLIGRGKFYFDRFDSTGASTGLRFIGEVDKGDITPKVTNKSRFTTTKAANNKIASVNTQQEYTLSFDPMEWIKENIALGFMGDNATYTQVSTAVTAEVIVPVGTAVRLDGVYQVAKRRISAVVVKVVATDATSTTLVAGTDYEIEDAGAGMIHILPGSATLATFPLTSKITVDYTPAAFTTPQVTAGTSLNIVGRVLFIGDPTSGPGMTLDCHRVKISSGSAIGLLSDDFASFTLTGEILDDSINNPTSPFFTVTYH